MKPLRTVSLSFSLVAGGAALLALANCQQDTTFVPYVKEICADRTDNDADGKLDCDDSDCLVECSVDITVVTPSPTSIDSIEIAGSSRNARSISVLVSPAPGVGRPAVLDTVTGDWTAWIAELKTPQAYKVTATATSPQNTHDTATTTVERRP